MAASLHRLTNQEIKSATKNTSLADGGGLLYRATAEGAGKWTFKFVSPDLEFRAEQLAKGRAAFQRGMGLGAYPAVTLAAARNKAAAARDLLAKGIDPIEEERRADEAARKHAEEIAQRASETILTFGRYADEVFLPFAVAGFSNPAHIQQWQASFRSHAKALRDKPMVAITRADVLEVLQGIWATKTVTASRTRQRIERLFSHAIQNGAYKGDNPAAWQQFDATLPSPRVTPRHHPAVPYHHIEEFIEALRAKEANALAGIMLEWIALSACRTGEARFAVWGEIDLANRVWSVPAERMKMRRGHVVPITKRMAELLELAKARHPATLRGEELVSNDLIFATAKGKPLSEMSALMLMRRMEKFGGYTPHGLRSTFKDWVSEQTDYPRELIEEQLAHQLGSVERAYKRGSSHERRRGMMEHWASVCDGEKPAQGTTVVPLFKLAAGT